MGPENFMGGGFVWMWIFPIIFFGMMIWMMSGRGSKCSHSHDNPQTKAESAKDILDIRFAKGEITLQEYEAMQKTLNG